MLPRTASHDSRHATGSTCATSAPPRALISRSPSTRTWRLPARARHTARAPLPPRTCTPERRVRVVRRASARSRCCPRAAPASFAPSPSCAALAAHLPARAAARCNAGAALLVLASPPPCALTPRVRPAQRIPARATRPCRAPERRARGSYPYPRAPRARLTHDIPPPHPREYGDSVPPRARSCSYLHPERRVRVVYRAGARSRCSAQLRLLRSRSARAPPRTCTPSARLAHRIPVSMSPRARI
ncbi:hypothetical protein DFH09DRAFT_1323834 [Mycena vulgaris]|nr:hypothetical protein DFH09DRAFT_1323834 [Mycena vulgaris]